MHNPYWRGIELVSSPPCWRLALAHSTSVRSLPGEALTKLVRRRVSTGHARAIAKMAASSSLDQPKQKLAESAEVDLILLKSLFY